jgi:hypothetical protein
LRLLWVAVHAPPGLSCPAEVRAVHEQGTSEAESVDQGHHHRLNEADAGSPMSWARDAAGKFGRARLGHLLCGSFVHLAGPCEAVEVARQKKEGAVCQEFGFQFALHTRSRRCNFPRRRHGLQNKFTLTETHGHVSLAFCANMPDDLEVCCRKAPPHRSCR